MNLHDKGIPTELIDSNGREIKSGDLVRYEYKVGVVEYTDKDGNVTYLQVVPFDRVIDKSHETVMEFKVGDEMSGFFLDLPSGINSNFFRDTVKYFVVDAR